MENNYSNQNANLTNRQKWELERKAKQGWKVYFIERDRVYNIQQYRNNITQMAENLRQDTSTLEYEHLRNVFLELYDKVGELVDCPVCLEAMTKEKTAIPLCGHLICKDCKARIPTCPICRKTYI